MNDTENSKSDFICKWAIIFLLAIMAAFVFTGCNTMKGIAQDVYAASEGLQNEMSKNSNSSSALSYNN